MKILIVSDEECPALWEYYVPGKLKEYDLIISCGDLNAQYLSFLVTMSGKPLFYVHGNHDTDYKYHPPWGCDCIDDAIVEYNGIHFLGLGGCLRYHPGRYQYTEAEMRRRIRRLSWRLKRLGGVDVVVTHAPPQGLGDGDDPAHWGFAALRTLLDKHHPTYLLHGHVHMSYGEVDRVREYRGTTLINTCERYVLEIPDVPVKEKNRNRILWKTRHLVHTDHLEE